jgi:3-oxoacyl-[acyl-carrier-protein] synthase II
MKRVVITGLGALTPIGNNVETYWNSLINGVGGAAPITRFDAAKFKTQFACELKNYDAQNFLDKAEIRRNDPFTQYALVAVAQAVEEARMNLQEIDATQIGVIWGTGNGGFATFEEQVGEFSTGDGTPRFNPFFIPRTIPNMASGVIAIKYGFQGINFSTVSACASSNTAFMDAFNYIRWGKAKIIISGGSEAPVTRASIGGFSAMKALSTRNEDPATACRPFDKDRDGFVMGEGAGALVLEEYEHALRRGATILAEVAGAAMTADAYHLSATHPKGEGAYRAMRLALEDANLTPAEVDYLNAHATSTPVGDSSEITAITRLFGDQPGRLKVSSTKSMTGHLLGAAGAIEAIASIKALAHGIIPPTINVNQIDPILPTGVHIVTKEALRQDLRVVMSNTFGFGGQNAIIVFKKFVS